MSFLERLNIAIDKVCGSGLSESMFGHTGQNYGRKGPKSTRRPANYQELAFVNKINALTRKVTWDDLRALGSALSPEDLSENWAIMDPNRKKLYSLLYSRHPSLFTGLRGDHDIARLALDFHGGGDYSDDSDGQEGTFDYYSDDDDDYYYAEPEDEFFD